MDKLKRNDLISIMIPAYNVDRYIDKCLETLCGQTYSNIEIVIVDDGSTDTTGKKCDEWAGRDDRIRVIHQENRGVSGARNACVRNATGEYVAFVDPDDMVATDYVETLYRCILDNDVPMAQGRSENFFSEEDIKNFRSTDDCRVLTGKEMCHILMTEYHKGWGILMTKMCKRSIYDDIVFPQGRIHEDDYCIYRLYWNAGKVALTDRIVYYYRSKREGSITHVKYSLHRLDSLDALTKRCEFFRQQEQQSLYEDACLSLCRARVSALQSMEKAEVENKEKVISEVRRDLKEDLRRLRSLKTISLKKKASVYMELYMPGIKKALVGRK